MPEQLNIIIAALIISVPIWFMAFNIMSILELAKSVNKISNKNNYNYYETKR